MVLPFVDRTAAGRDLASELTRLGVDSPVVLGVPRGGVAVAAPVAASLSGTLDVLVVRKIGAPGNPELGLGAVGASGDPWVDEDMVRRLAVRGSFLSREIETQRREAARRDALYRGARGPVDVSGRDVVVVDDGVATGGSVVAAASLLRGHGPGRLVLAVPVCPAQARDRLEQAYDHAVVLHTPEPFVAVGRWYRDFHQLTDAEVEALLRAHR